jgi:membrane-bound lytic murein transglycosylase B
MTAAGPPEDFDALLASASGEGASPSTPGPDRRARAGIAVLVSVGFLGVAVAATAFIVPAVAPAPGATTDASGELAAAASTSGPTPTPTRPPAATSTPVPLLTAGPAVSELADAGWVASTAAATGIPERALSAYAGSAVRMTTERPFCGIGWNTLAAIGLVESEHGTLHGGSIGEDGRALPRIVGIALDGSGVDAITDTDDGALDGDAVWDRAVGPMQFIPSTWRSHGADGDGDGRRDPDSIDDASLAAARYLCTAGDDLTTDGGWIAAISAYNTSIDYNNRVAAAADAYAAQADR